MTESDILVLPNNERAAFQDIFREYYPLVRGIAGKVLCDDGEADEATQEVFLKLYQKWPRTVITTSLSAWLSKAALNSSFNRLRSRKQALKLKTKLENMSSAAQEPSAAELFSADERRLLVREALLKLRPRDRKCLIARHSGLSYREVAEVVGIRVSSVGKVLARAEEKFKLAFEEISGGSDK